jgi:hypothetical protein
VSTWQTNLFGIAPYTSGQPSAEIIALVRSRLHAALALVRPAQPMPGSDQLAIIREDNVFRYGKDILPPRRRSGALDRVRCRDARRAARLTVAQRGCGSLAA